VELVGVLNHLSWTLWFLGYPEQALQKIRASLALAHELSHAYDLAYALGFAGFLHLFRREGRPAEERAEAQGSMTRAHGFAMFHAQAMMLRGGALAAKGQTDASIAEMSQGLAAWLATGATLSRTYWLGRLADAHTVAGKPREALPILAKAMGVVENDDERFWEAELQRLRGEALLALPEADQSEAEAHMRDRDRTSTASEVA
jgi:predicted ATPase